MSLIAAVAFTSVLLAATTDYATGAVLSLDFGGMSMGLFGGLALFLLGMNFLSDGLKNAAGDQMRVVLQKFTKNRVMAAITGAGVTAVVQSSSVTTVLVVGFVSAGVMSLQQSVGVIMGANVGSTMTAQIVAFSVEEYAPAMITLGFFTNFIAKKDRTRHLGSILLGLGLVFFGMGMMSAAMVPLRGYEPFLRLMQSIAESPFLAILIAALFTALVQSSSATTSIIVVMSSEGLVSLEAGIAMALGANIGTCVTAALSSIGKPLDARRAAAVHVIFNVAGVLLWLPLISFLASLTVSVSPSYPDLVGAERLAVETPRQIANANTLFNVINTVIFLFFTQQIAALAIRLVPESRSTEATVSVVPEFLDDALLSTPVMALQAAREETARLGGLAQNMLDEIWAVVQSGDKARLDEAESQAKTGAALLPQITRFLARVGESELREADADERVNLAIAATELNMVSEILNVRILPVLRTIRSNDEELGLSDMYKLMEMSVRDAVSAVRDRDKDAAMRVLGYKDAGERAFASLAAAQVLTTDDKVRAEDLRLRIELAQTLRVLMMITRRAARTVLRSGDDQD